MIKARLQVGSEPLIVLGLSGENVTRLMADEPIMFELAELGLGPGRLAILGGHTEASIVAQMETVGLIPLGTGDTLLVRKPER